MEYSTKLSYSYQDRTGKCLGTLAKERALRSWSGKKFPEYAYVGDFKDGTAWVVKTHGILASYDFNEKEIEDFGIITKKGNGKYTIERSLEQKALTTYIGALNVGAGEDVAIRAIKPLLKANGRSPDSYKTYSIKLKYLIESYYTDLLNDTGLYTLQNNKEQEV